MAPQQNSTLIEGTLNACPSLLNLPGEEIQNYSPILPPKNNHENQQKYKSNNNNNMNDNNSKTEDNKDKVQSNIIRKRFEYEQQSHKKQEEKLEATEHICHGQPGTNQQPYHCRWECKSKNYRNGRPTRSISLYGVNSTVEQGNKEIPIWLADEPRYVSGVTNKTTCNDIIEALICDEQRNGNEHYNKPSKDGGAAIAAAPPAAAIAAAAALRDYSDYVITESWRGIERSYDGNMAILPVWRAWSRVHNELRLTMKHVKDISDPQQNKCQKRQSCSLLKYVKKLLGFTKSKSKPKPAKTNNHKAKENCLKSSKKISKSKIPDEFFVVILPDQLYEKVEFKSHTHTHAHSGADKNLKGSSHNVAKVNKTKLYKLAESRTTVRKRHSAGRRSRRREAQRLAAAEAATNNCIKRRRDAPLRSSLRNKLAQKNAEMNVRYERELELTKVLAKKCRLYRLQNELYTNPTAQMEISVGQVQHNIEQYAAEIIQTEHELLKLKNEIRQDISIMNNLKRMTLEEIDGVSDCGVPLPSATPAKLSLLSTAVLLHTAHNDEKMQFVDNIYEFCDNNASMLV